MIRVFSTLLLSSMFISALPVFAGSDMKRIGISFHGETDLEGDEIKSLTENQKQYTTNSSLCSEVIERQTCYFESPNNGAINFSSAAVRLGRSDNFADTFQNFSDNSIDFKVTFHIQSNLEVTLS